MLRLHNYIPCSFANGPGSRAVVWTQGCKLACPGCFNKESHDSNSGYLVCVQELASRVISEPGIEGLTVSGGEPFQQAAALTELLSQIKSRSDLSIIVYSGFYYEEAKESLGVWKELLSHVDVLIAGPFIESKKLARGLRGSSNKIMHFLTSRYCSDDFVGIPDTEVLIQPDGKIVLTGVDPFDLSISD